MKSTTIMAVASMHQLHKEHPSFDYDKLFQVIEHFHPDYVGVEIRPEDIGTNEVYLRKNYPFEMVKISIDYDNDRCFGFDWLGEDIAGQPIPNNYWKDISIYKRLERELSDDASMISNKLAVELDNLFEQQMDILKTATAASLIDGRYGIITKRYYQVSDDFLRGTKYELISEFRRRRDQEIGKNIVNFIYKHLGTRIAVVMGANHHVYALEALSNNLEIDNIIYEQPA
jgi:hypothetical protein